MVLIISATMVIIARNPVHSVLFLIVTFFKNVIHTTFDGPLGILYLGLGILFVALALYFTARSGHGGEK